MQQSEELKAITKEYKKFKTEIENCVNSFLRSNSPRISDMFLNEYKENNNHFIYNGELYDSIDELLDKHSTIRNLEDVKFRAHGLADVYPYYDNCLYQMVSDNKGKDKDYLEFWFGKDNIGEGCMLETIKQNPSLIYNLNLEIHCVREGESNLRIVVWANGFKFDNEVYMDNL